MDEKNPSGKGTFCIEADTIIWKLEEPKNWTTDTTSLVEKIQW